MPSRREGPLGLAFLLDAAKLGTVSAFSQGLVLLCFPLITRLYSPAELGEWGSIVAVSGVCATVAGGRMELAIPTARPGEQAAIATTAALLATLSMSALLVLGAVLGASRFSPLWLWVGPITVVQHWNNVVTTLALAQGRFSSMAFSGWLMVCGLLGFQLVPKVAGYEGEWLFWGSTVGPILSGAFLLWRVQATAGLGAGTSVAMIRWTLRRHGRKPRLLAPAALLNASALNLPIPLVRVLFGPEWAGVLTVTLKGIGGPLALVGQAVAHVYFSRASLLLTSRPEELNELYRRLTRALLISSLAIFPLIALVPDSFYALVLGDQFQKAGPLVRALLPSFACQFSVAPVAMTLTILGRESWQLAWDALRLTQAAGSLTVPALLGLGVSDTILLYSLTGAGTYLLYDRVNRIALQHVRSLNTGRDPL